MSAPPALRTSAATSATSGLSNEIATSAASRPRALRPGASLPRARLLAAPLAAPLLLPRRAPPAVPLSFSSCHGSDYLFSAYAIIDGSAMNTRLEPISGAGSLPAQRIDAAGHAHVDQRAVLALALPLMANAAIQIILNLTDMWFIGHISTIALAGVAAVQWLVLVAVLILGGVASAVADDCRAILRSAPLRARIAISVDCLMGNAWRGHRCLWRSALRVT